MDSIRILCAFAVIATSATQVHAAITWTASQGSSGSYQSGTYQIDLGTFNVNDSGPVRTTSSSSDTLVTGETGGVGYTVQGGALFNATQPQPNPGISGISARPNGSTGTWYSIGTSGGQTTPGTITFSQSINYFSLLWGSPDQYNDLVFFEGAHEIGRINGSALGASQSWSEGDYVNVFANGAAITSIQFVSSQNAFEVGNMSFGVPEPGSYALLVTGFLAVAGRSVRAKGGNIF